MTICIYGDTHTLISILYHECHMSIYKMCVYAQYLCQQTCDVRLHRARFLPGGDGVLARTWAMEWPPDNLRCVRYFCVMFMCLRACELSSYVVKCLREYLFCFFMHLRRIPLYIHTRNEIRTRVWVLKERAYSSRLVKHWQHTRGHIITLNS